ncbi:hypothetical protein J3Q64DRAFT_1777484 [Phycomyces blakesleeanus]|uniref:Uncharacterized protein n=2 Tax=Phycomyces blakesleeanus TaxID=4837 RepID=A0A162T2G4_PHYB8|nr:hypothetical protein PHYBLDRAFT_184094 [Phycomyces blakesleeanus NRRL 1555(-)]OAD65732.1 hypothetical protein PHYBLDRAFT_184094 [Phycomyces blakesleeanus NRRL 1555(-)]|eukprot:XP_018283772.1 hypothetical protein PHYBLDRAFT_184094 [Phycomyces blakesleeanus NRRL 1555(-)]
MNLKEKVKPPRSLRSTRLSVVKNKISTPINFQQSAITPKIVAKALFDYKAQTQREISFHQGDYFHVDKTDNPHWFEAFNPVTHAKGIVPVNYFQILEKNDTPNHLGDPTRTETQLPPVKKMQPLYGVVLYDFQAERFDELDARAGESILVIAQSNVEWFVAKPIGRLGGPGLIPVSFVEIRDALTGHTITSSQPSNPLPRVEEWKRMTMGHDNPEKLHNPSSSALYYAPNTIDTFSRIPTHNSVNTLLGSSNAGSGAGGSASASASAGAIITTAEQIAQEIGNLSIGPRDNSRDNTRSRVVAATVDSYVPEGDQFWFIVFAQMSDRRHRVLYRLYEDFYDFQVTLLQDYPIEAGKTGKPRILPFMPGPQTEVDERLTAKRQTELNIYCQELFQLPRYLVESPLVQDVLFVLHEGDVEIDYDPRTGAPRPESVELSHSILIPEAFGSSTMNTFTPFGRNSNPIKDISQTNTATATATATASTTTTAAKNAIGSSNLIKVKIAYKEEMFAIKVPIDCSFQKLHDRVQERLGGSNVRLRYKDQTQGESLPLETESDIAEAFESSLKIGKLILYATPL